MKTVTIGLVRSGGGYRGIAYAGALKAFEEVGIFPTHISGVSLGALVGALYADGGILDNFPIAPIQNCSHIYGVYVSPISIMKATEFKHSYDVINQALQLRMNASSEAKFSACDIVVYPEELSRYNLFNAKYTDELFEIGYAQTLQALQDRNPVQRNECIT